MALPTTIGDADTSMPDKNYYCGPFKSSGGNFYVLTSEFDGVLANELVIFKATDPTISFAVQDVANQPSVNIAGLNDPVETAWAFQVGDILHIAFLDRVTSRKVRHITFDMSTDLWGSNLVVEVLANPPSSSSVSLAVRDGGAVIVLYNGDTDQVMGQPRDRVDHARKENGTFATVGVEVSDSPSDTSHNWYGSVVVKDRSGSDRMHFFFKNQILADAFQRTLLSDNSLETFPAAGDPTIDNFFALHIFGPGISYDDGGIQKIRCPYGDDDQKAHYAEFDSVDAPGAFTDGGAKADNVVDTSAQSWVMCLSVDGLDEHLLYSDRTDLDLFHDKNGGTDVEELDGVTVTRISCNVYDRSGTKLAFVYDDGGIIKYDEIGLPVISSEQSLWESEGRVLKAQGILWESEELLLPAPSGMGAAGRIHLGNFSSHRPPF